MLKPTLVLIGDSILDNAPYTRPEPDTTALLQQRLPGWSIERLAQDGATMDDAPLQLKGLDTPRSVAVLSIGGNDATEHIGLLDQRISSAAELLEQLLALAEGFGRRYDLVAQAVAERATRTILCTIYEVQLEPPPFARLARVPLAILNDRIIRTGVRLGLEVLELRSVCTEPADFVFQIEPSAQGAVKIADAITALLGTPPQLQSATVFGRSLRT